MINKKIIKTEGMAGLLYTRNLCGDYVAADSAIKGDSYKCPFCDCDMHVTKSSAGMKYFARNPGSVHTHAICISVESKKVQHSFDGLNPSKLIGGLCHVSPRGGTSRESGNALDPGGNSEGGHDPEIKNNKFSSLKQIYDAGIYYLNPDDQQGEHKVSEYIITFKYGHQFFTNPDFRLGCRIVMARYDGFDSKAQSIIFSQFNSDYSVKFRLVFTKKSDFKIIRDKFAVFAEDEQTGKTILVKKHMVQDVLIACDNWEYVSRGICSGNCSYSYNCERCCGMYQAVFTSKKQLYLIPSDH